MCIQLRKTQLNSLVTLGYLGCKEDLIWEVLTVYIFQSQLITEIQSQDTGYQLDQTVRSYTGLSKDSLKEDGAVS